MQHYSHLATATNILWKLIEANGHDPEPLYRDVGINPDLLQSVSRGYLLRSPSDCNASFIIPLHRYHMGIIQTAKTHKLVSF